MGLFDIFKRRDEYDITNMRVTDLREGFVFDYDLSTWEVEEMFEYDWGNDYFSWEFKIRNEKETAFLSVDEDDEVEISLAQKVKIASLGSDIYQQLRDNQEPPAEINFKGKKFLLDEERAGYCRNMTRRPKDWEEFVAWTYYEAEDKYILTIEQWDENEFDASYGKLLKEYEISNIMPR